MTSSPEMRLLEALTEEFQANQRKCTVRPDQNGGLCVMFYEHPRGYWRHEPSGYVFFASRDGAATYRCATIAEAVQFTLGGVCRT